MRKIANGPKRLLAVDDHSDSAELVARIAEDCGYEAKFMADAHALVSILEAWKPDVLALDLCMPEDDGFSILPTLRKVSFKGSLVVISGQDEWLRQAACDLAEINGIQSTCHLRKPIEIDVLRDLLNTLRVIN